MPDGSLRTRWRHLREDISWAPPTSTDIGVVLKSGLAAGLSWLAAGWLTDIAAPVLAPLTAIVVVQVSVRASVMSAIQRSAAVVIGVLLAVGLGDVLGLNALTIAALVVVSLSVAMFVLRLPTPAARQVPISALVVLAALGSGPQVAAWERALDTVIGAAVGVLVSMIVPASRLVDARQTIERLGTSTAAVLQAMGEGLHQEWSVEQTTEWRRRARATRERLVQQATEAVGSGRESARWNLLDRRHVDLLGRYESVLPRLERTAIGTSVISRGLDDHARLGGSTHRSMGAMGDLFVALGGAVTALVHEVLAEPHPLTVTEALAEVHARRARCVAGAAKRARLALEHLEDPDGEPIEGEWLGYTALLVQVDRIVGDLSAPLPA